MAFREVTMFEIKDVLLAWIGGRAIKYITRNMGIDRNTVRRYVRAAEAEGLSPALGKEGLTEAVFARVLARLDERPNRPRKEAWSACEARRSFIEKHLADGVTLAKINRLLRRQNVEVPYATLNRFAKEMLGFGQSPATIPVADGAPGSELQVDTGWMTTLESEPGPKRKRFRAWIFTASHSRHRFIYPVMQETTNTAIEACEAAWEFFGGIFLVLVPDNTKAIIQTADPLYPKITEAFREYAIHRGFEIDTARVRKPKDKARVERAVQTAREDCFRGEILRNMTHAREHAMAWCKEYGMRRHSSTKRMPLEHFDNAEKPILLARPTEAYDVPQWCEPKVAPDQHAQVLGALYSLPRKWIGKKLQARADRPFVCFYHNRELVKKHTRMHAGGRSMDKDDFPKEQFATAQRDLAFWKKRAHESGMHVGLFTEALLAGNQPWTRLRRVFALLGLCKKYTPESVNQSCALALDADMIDIRRLRRMLEQDCPTQEKEVNHSNVILMSRYARPSEHFKPKTTRNDGGLA